MFLEDSLHVCVHCKICKPLASLIPVACSPASLTPKFAFHGCHFGISYQVSDSASLILRHVLVINHNRIVYIDIDSILKYLYAEFTC